jgi:ribonuclease HI
LNNPGLSGAGVVFAGRNTQNEGIQQYGKVHLQQNEEFLFGISLHLGTCSNNYAEYSAFILA